MSRDGVLHHDWHCHGVISFTRVLIFFAGRQTESREVMASTSIEIIRSRWLSLIMKS